MSWGTRLVRVTVCGSPEWAPPKTVVASQLSPSCAHWVSHESTEYSVSTGTAAVSARRQVVCGYVVCACQQLVYLTGYPSCQWVEKPETPLDGASQWPPYGMWGCVAAALSVRAPVEDRRWWVVHRTALERRCRRQVSFANEGSTDCRWHGGVDFPTALKVNMDSALRDAVLECNVQRHWEEPDQHILALEQEPHGPEEPSISDTWAVRDDVDECYEIEGPHLAASPFVQQK